MIHYRDYDDYQHYLEHQAAKLPSVLAKHGDKIAASPELTARLSPFVTHGQSVLCLGARLGGEVLSFWQMGCFAVGIDIAPGNSATVLLGDFHEIAFPNRSIDVIYCNAFDHAKDMPSVFYEIYRTLKPCGVLIADIAGGTQEECFPGAYEACWWDVIDDVVSVAKKMMKPEIVSREPISFPWVGECIVFRKG